MFKNKHKMKQKRRSAWKSKLFSAFALVMAIISLSPTLVSASNSYFLTFTYDLDSNSIMPGVEHSDVGNGVEKHLEIEKSGNFLFANGGDNESSKIFRQNNDGSDLMNTSVVPMELSDMKGYFPEDRDDYSDGNKYTLPFSFPGRHVGTGTGSGLNDADKARNADTNDQQQANWVGQQLTSGFNRLVSVAYSAELANGKANDLTTLHSVAAKLANSALSGNSATFGGDALVIDFNTVGSSIDLPTGDYIPNSFYRSVTIKGGDYGNSESMLMPIAVPKGYDQSGNSYLAPILENDPYYRDDYSNYAGEDVHHITWSHMVLQASHNAHVKGIVSGNQKELGEVGRVEKVLLGIFGDLPNVIKNWLGLEPITDLVFNQGTHGATTVRGTMPRSLAQVADFVYMLVLLLSVIVMLGSFVSLLIKSNLSVINPQMRVDVKDSMLNIIGAFLLLVAFPPIWRSLMAINSELVNYFFGISKNISDLGLGLVSGSGGIALIILSIAFLIVEIWFNFYYITRALTIMVLYMFAPLMIISIAYGGRYKMIFENWLKELIGALFTQGIHAAVLGSIFAGLDRGLGGSMIWQFVILISIIPISNLFRKTILNLGGDSISQSAERGEKGFLTAGAIGTGLAIKGASAAGGAAVGKIAGTSGGKGGSISKYSSSGGDGGGTGKTKLGDEVGDQSGTGVTTGQQIYDTDSGWKKAGSRVGQLKENTTNKLNNFKKDMKEAPGKTSLNMAKNATQKTAQSIQSGVAGKALSVGNEVGGALLTAGALIGDVATDGGSSQAMIAGQRLLGSNDKRDKFDNGRPLHNGNESLMSMKDDSQLEFLEKSHRMGSEGELMNQAYPDGSGAQVLTSNVNAMGNAQSGSDYEVGGPSEQYENGYTSYNYDSESISSDVESSLDRASHLSERVASGDKLSDVEYKDYDNMRSTGIANVQKNDSGGYNVTVDHKALGWDKAETDGKYYMAKADADVNKRLPNFNNANDSRVKQLNSWNQGITQRENEQDSKISNIL